MEIKIKMKKLNFLLTIFFICSTYVTSYAFVNKQHQWWNYRLKKIEKIETHLKKNNKIDIKVLGLTFELRNVIYLI